MTPLKNRATWLERVLLEVAKMKTSYHRQTQDFASILRPVIANIPTKLQKLRANLSSVRKKEKINLLPVTQVIVQSGHPEVTVQSDEAEADLKGH